MRVCALVCASVCALVCARVCTCVCACVHLCVRVLLDLISLSGHSYVLLWISYHYNPIK